MTDSDDDQAARDRRRSDLWALARAEYLAGGSAAEVCERHGLKVSTLRWRARQEGWRRADHPASDPDAPFSDRAVRDIADDADTLATMTLAEVESALYMAAMAWFHTQQAIRRGRMFEARGWVRLHRDLTAIAEAKAATARTADPAIEGAIATLHARLREKLLALAE